MDIEAILIAKDYPGLRSELISDFSTCMPHQWEVIRLIPVQKDSCTCKAGTALAKEFAAFHKMYPRSKLTSSRGATT